jgi:uncharacterized SAM-binding protein YcdF (DUF218 family)
VERLAIVVPGASVRSRDGRWALSPGCLACVGAAGRLAGERPAVAVVFTGYAPGGGRESEADQMQAAWNGPTGPELVLERWARNTAENAARTMPLLREREIGAAIVVCSWIHQGRVRFFFRRLYGEAGIRTSVLPVRGGLSARAVFWELAAVPVAWSQRRRASGRRGR